MKALWNKKTPSRVQLSRQAMQRFEIRSEVQRIHQELRDKERSELEEYGKATHATMLWALHTHPDLKFGKKRLRKFWEWMIQTRIEFRNFYRGEISPDDSREECTGHTSEDYALIAALRDIGVDLEAWEDEVFHVDDKTGHVTFDKES